MNWDWRGPYMRYLPCQCVQRGGRWGGGRWGWTGRGGPMRAGGERRVEPSSPNTPATYKYKYTNMHRVTANLYKYTHIYIYTYTYTYTHMYLGVMQIQMQPILSETTNTNQFNWTEMMMHLSNMSNIERSKSYHVKYREKQKKVVKGLVDSLHVWI